MHSFQSLILLRRQELNEKRRQLVELEVLRDSIANQKSTLMANIEHEAQFASNNPHYAYTWTHFLHGTRQQIMKLESSIAEVEESIQAARLDVHAAYIDMRKFELTRDNQLAKLKKEQNHREKQELDEIGLSMYRRQAQAREKQKNS